MGVNTGKLKLVLRGINVLILLFGLIIIGISAWLLIKPEYVFDVVMENDGQENINYDTIKTTRQKVQTYL